jgi:hypothetical protein
MYASLTSCCTQTQWGACVYPQKCGPIISYSGNSLELAKLTIPISGTPTTVVEGVKWDTKQLQQAAAISQAMDIQRVRQCQTLNAGLGSLSYAEYEKLFRQMTDNQSKLDQLAFLVISGNEKALNNWIVAYSSGAPTGASALGGGTRAFAPNKQLVSVEELMR